MAGESVICHDMSLHIEPKLIRARPGIASPVPLPPSTRPQSIRKARNIILPSRSICRTMGSLNLMVSSDVRR